MMIQNEKRIAQLEDEVRLLKEQLEQQRSESSNMLAALRNIGEAVIRTDADGGRIRWLNAAAVGMACIVNLKVRNKPLYEVFHFALDEAFTQPVDPLAVKETQTGKPLQADNMFMRSLAGGTVYRVQCSVSSIYTGKNGDIPEGRVLVLKDLTEFHNALHAVRANEQKLGIEQHRLQILGDNLPGGCLYRFAYDTATGHAGFTYLSSSWEKISGIAVEDILNDSDLITAYMLPEDKMAYGRAFLESLSTMNNFNLEIRFLLPSGETRWGKLSSVPHREGTSVVWDGFLMDITDNKTAELTLRAEKERLEAIGDNYPDGCLFRAVMDMRTQKLKLTYVSKPWENLTGIPAEAVVNDVQLALSRIHPDDLPVYMADTVKSAQTGENMNTDIRFVMDDGSMKWAQIASHPHTEEHLVVWDGFFLDITARKQTEFMLLAEKERLETIGDNIPGGALYRFKINPVTRDIELDYVSDTWQNVIGISPDLILGLSPEEAQTKGLTIFDGIEPEDMPMLMERMDHSLTDMVNFSIELRFRRPDGKLLWLMMSAKPSLQNGTIYIDGMIFDITARKEAEQQLLFEKNRLQALGDNLPNGVLFRFQIEEALLHGPNAVDWLQQMKLSYASALWDTFSNIPLTDAMNDVRLPFMKIHPDDLAVIMPLMHQAMLNHTNFYAEVRYMYTDDDMRWFQISANPHKEDNTVVIDGFILDVTARKEAEQRLLAEKERLRSIGDNMPDGILYRSRINLQTGHMRLEYASAMWEKLSGVPVEAAHADLNVFFARMEPEDFDEMMRLSRKSIDDMAPFNFEFGYHHPIDGKTHRIRIASVPVADGESYYADGTLFDVTESRKAAAELETYRHDLERLVQERTDELRSAGEELASINEELYAINIEMNSKNEQLSNEIAARTEVMKKLEDSESKIRNFIHYSSEGILMMDGEGRIVEWNGAMTRITGIAQSEAIGEYNCDLLERFLPEEKAGAGIYERIRRMEMEYIAGGPDREPSIREDRLFMPDGSERYLRVSVFPIALTGTCYFGKILHDVTERRQIDIELERYRTQLEEMVEIKSRDLLAVHTDLEATARRQTLFIKILQMLQMEPDVPSAMNMALAELGAYTGVDRLATWENHPDGVTYGCTHEWCNDGVEPAIQYLGSIPVEEGKPWFDMMKKDDYICTSDMSTLHPYIQGMLEKQGVKAIAVFPMSILGAQFGFLSFNFCRVKEWNVYDVELMNQMAQIMGTVTRRWQVETALNASREIMQKVLDNVNANIFVTDYDSLEIIFANQKFRNDAPGKVEGVECWKMLNAGKNRVCDHCPKSDLLDENSIIYWEDFNSVTKRWYAIHSTILRWIDGRRTIMELALDITERKAVEAELIRAKEKAEESDRLKSAFLANVSHEIRTPLNGIIGFLQFLSSEALVPERRREYTRIVNSNGTQLVKLIDDIIDISKIEAQQMKINPVPVQLNSLMSDLYTFFDAHMRSAGKEHVALVLDESGFVPGCTVLIDPMRLRQVLNNLIGNAVKFTEKGYINFGYRQTAPAMLEFWVEDTGIGIPSSMHKIIFERFRQAETEQGGSGRIYGGTGLGLAISYSLVQLMGGDMTVESAEGSGSTFRFTVGYTPAAEPPLTGSIDHCQGYAVLP